LIRFDENLAVSVTKAIVAAPAITTILAGATLRSMGNRWK